METPSGLGKQPAVDLLAYQKDNYCLAIIGLKISRVAERQAITELSAHNQGLQNHFRNLSALEVLWLPVSRDWRTTLVSALEFQIVWNGVMTVPLKLNLIQDNKQTIWRVQNFASNTVDYWPFYITFYQCSTNHAMN